MSLAFLACVEKGNLENQALLLFRSIRKFAGKYSDAPIYSFQPRVGPALKKETLKAFDKLGVIHSTKILNIRHHTYPIGNKIYVCAHAEKNLSEDVLVFMDSDTVFLGEPGDLDLPDGVAVAVRPSDNKNRGSSGPGDHMEAFWQKAYEITGAPPGQFVETVISKERLRAYWNAGLIAARRDQGVFGRWREDFLKLSKSRKIYSKKNIIDQVSLAMTLSRIPEKVRILDYHYNYSLPKRIHMSPPMSEADLDTLVQIHYHRWFNRPGFLKLLEPQLNTETEAFIWLERQLPFKPTIDDKMREEMEDEPA